MGVKCGVDIIEIHRIKKSIENLGGVFLNRIFTPEEIRFCESKNFGRYQSYAARFAAKEAVSKALGTGISKGVSFKDIEIICDSSGNPKVLLKDKALEIYEKIEALGIDISISHCREYAVASVVIQVRRV